MGELDELYAAKPEDFTALRTELSAAAKKRGDVDVAKQVAKARKPTTAAWVVNRLAHDDSDAVAQLRDLGARMRAAHAAGSGERIRELTSEQRQLVDQLTRKALRSAELHDPTAALRDDVHGTLVAAVADPDVTGRLGRLVKAERWSGFGDVTETWAVFSNAPAADEEAPSTLRATPKRAVVTRVRDNTERARAELTAAQQSKDKAEAALVEHRDNVFSARQRREEARKALQKADRDLAKAETSYDDARTAVDSAAKAVREARAKIKRR